MSAQKKINDNPLVRSQCGNRCIVGGGGGGTLFLPFTKTHGTSDPKAPLQARYSYFADFKAQRVK